MFHPAVKVRQAYKKLGNEVILNNFNMTCMGGEIYVLLGASGCGKTTILNCINGLKTLGSGEITVFGALPGQRIIGFMPQELALDGLFTVEEVLFYYGRLYGMTYMEILDKIAFLCKFLELPQSYKLINSFSGGQQKKISLAVALLLNSEKSDEPTLFILDEPTQGLDALLRENVWNYLVKLVSNNKRKSILLSTHYFQEAKMAHKIGYMRNGHLLIEKSPQSLLDEHNTNLLEDVVMKFCRKDDDLKSCQVNNPLYHSSFTKDEAVIGLKYKPRSPEDNCIFFYNQSAHKESKSEFLRKQILKIQALTYRNFIQLFRNWVFLLIFIVMPAVQVILFQIVIGKEPKNLDIAVVNHEFEGNDFMDLCRRNTSSGCFHEKLSCDFLNQFPSSMNLRGFLTEEEALNSVRLGDTKGYISIPQNFTENMKYRFVEANFVTNDTLDGSTLSLRFDMSDRVINIYLGGTLYGNYVKFLQKVATDCGESERRLQLPFKYNAVSGSLDAEYTDYIQPAVVISMMLFIASGASGPLITDKQLGILDRTLIAGVNYFQVVFSFLISQGCLIIVQLTLSTIVLWVLGFNFQGGSIFLFFLLSFLAGICGLSFGFLFGTLCNNIIEVVAYSVALFLVGVSTCGFTTPLEGTPPWALFAIKFLPSTLGVKSARLITLKGWEFSHPEVWAGFASISMWILVCTILSILVHRAKKQ